MSHSVHSPYSGILLLSAKIATLCLDISGIKHCQRALSANIEGSGVPQEGSLGRLKLDLLTAQKKFIHVGQFHLHPGGAAMIALAGALGAFHIAQQGIHLGDV